MVKKPKYDTKEDLLAAIAYYREEMVKIQKCFVRLDEMFEDLQSRVVELEDSVIQLEEQSIEDIINEVVPSNDTIDDNWLDEFLAPEVKKETTEVDMSIFDD